ncbi:MAG TPA: PfkB family carbohydrate kinase [Bacteroidia bacterium]|jgi:sugar/nucleoside kinase (ribokinase family)|nr:PfkB family carbohydrate kinase [Bacteroidia bacterium]
MSLLVVGTVAFDSIETPFGKVDKTVGGAATYIALSASSFTHDIEIVSVIGEDFPAETIKEFHKRKIDTTGLQVMKGQKSFYWAGKYHTDMNSRDTLVTELNVLADFDPIVPQGYKNADFLMLGNLMPIVQQKVIKQMSKRPKLIVMDTMDYWMSSVPKELAETIAMVDVLTINDAEARQLSGEYSLVKAAQKILKMGPKYLIIKKGEHGALLFNEDRVFYAPALPLEEVFDPTGAGDSFAGGFIGFLDKTKDISFDNMKRAIIFGSAIASFCVEKFGIQRLLEISKNDLEERVHEFVELVQFDITLV